MCEVKYCFGIELHYTVNIIIYIMYFCKTSRNMPRIPSLSSKFKRYKTLSSRGGEGNFLNRCIARFFELKQIIIKSH